MITETIDGYTITLERDGTLTIDPPHGQADLDRSAFARLAAGVVAPELALVLYMFFMRDDAAEHCENLIMLAEQAAERAEHQLAELERSAPARALTA